MSYIIKKSLEIIQYRFKLSEFVDLILDNIANIVPTDYVENVLGVLNNIIDELIWI